MNLHTDSNQQEQSLYACLYAGGMPYFVVVLFRNPKLHPAYTTPCLVVQIRPKVLPL
jgi:hypothetical protein